MNEATKASAGAATSSAAVPSWRSSPSTRTPIRSASAAASSKSWVTSRTGMSSSASRSCSSARTDAFVCASSADSGSSRRRTAGSRASARATATRWRSPPDSRAGRSLREVRDPEALEQLAGAGLAAVLDVAPHGQVREERVVLEDEPGPALVGLQVDRLQGVEPRLAAGRDPPGLGPRQPGDRAQHRRLAGPRRPDERDGALDLERQPDVESPKRERDPVEDERHESARWRAARRRMLTPTSTPPIASAASKSTSNSA